MGIEEGVGDKMNALGIAERVGIDVEGRWGCSADSKPVCLASSFNGS